MPLMELIMLLAVRFVTIKGIQRFGSVEYALQEAY